MSDPPLTLDSCDMDVLEDLAAAVRNLDDEVKHWMGVALTSGRHRIGAIRWETELARCPIAAAATEAGIWHTQGIDAAHTAWSHGDGPNLAVEEFAACFDLACEDHGLPAALSIVTERLGCSIARTRRRTTLSAVVSRRLDAGVPPHDASDSSMCKSDDPYVP